MSVTLEQIERVQINGKRWYQVKQGEEIIGTFPSVTSVLGSTKDKTALNNWAQRIGQEAADKVGKDSTDRGTVMHRLCELYLNLPIDLSNKDRFNETLELARTDEEIIKFDPRAIIMGAILFNNFYSTGCFDRVKQVIAQEQFLWCKAGGGFAGTVDNFSLLDDGARKVVDFKTAKKAKAEAWIEDYKMQASAYCIAIWERTGIKPDGAEIWISNEVDRFPQCFMLNWNDVTKYFKLFTERLNAFHAANPLK
jgi:genome maintenance exonuclease 1